MVRGGSANVAYFADCLRFTHSTEKLNDSNEEISPAERARVAYNEPQTLAGLKAGLHWSRTTSLHGPWTSKAMTVHAKIVATTSLTRSSWTNCGLKADLHWWRPHEKLQVQGSRMMTAWKVVAKSVKPIWATTIADGQGHHRVMERWVSSSSWDTFSNSEHVQTVAAWEHVVRTQCAYHSK